MYEKLSAYCANLEAEFEQIPDDRRQVLEELGHYFRYRMQSGESIAATVICTHNSRRSHMGQLWLMAAASYYGLQNVKVASGGTEATAFNQRAVRALQSAGMRIDEVHDGANPLYKARFSRNMPPINMFSKAYDHPDNPGKGFAAIMVCSEADAACPVVPGAEMRFSLPFTDPKHADGTPGEVDAYDRCCRKIAREMFYAVRFATSDPDDK